MQLRFTGLQDRYAELVTRLEEIEEGKTEWIPELYEMAPTDEGEPLPPDWCTFVSTPGTGC